MTARMGEVYDRALIPFDADEEMKSEGRATAKKDARLPEDAGAATSSERADRRKEQNERQGRGAAREKQSKQKSDKTVRLRASADGRSQGVV